MAALRVLLKDSPRCARVSLNADVRVGADDRAALERLLCYVLRPALSLRKLSYDARDGVVRY